jgi:hypothetical protein
METAANKKAPDGLSDWAKGVWADLHAEYEFSRSDALLLEQGLRQFDRADECGVVVAREGLVMGRRPHPLLGVQRDCLQAGLRFVRALEASWARKAARRGAGRAPIPAWQPPPWSLQRKA